MHREAMDNTKSLDVLKSYARRANDAKLVEDKNRARLILDKDGLKITITVPISAQEWFVDVEELITGLRAEDWYDYASYEPRAVADLCHDMAEDLDAFIGNITSKPLRARRFRPEKTACVIEWQIDGVWKPAVPASGV